MAQKTRTSIYVDSAFAALRLAAWQQALESVISAAGELTSDVQALIQRTDNHKKYMNELQAENEQLQARVNALELADAANTRSLQELYERLTAALEGGEVTDV